MTQSPLGHWAQLPYQALPWAALLPLLLMTAAFFFLVPYAGFDWLDDGQIVELFVEAVPQNALLVGDRLVQVGPVSWAAFNADLRQTIFAGVQPGQIVPLLAVRAGQTISIPWVFPGFSSSEVLARLNSAWWLPYAFWLAGTAAWRYVRPRDERWRALVAFNYLTALWLAAGSGPSRWHVLESAFLLRSGIWLSVPVYWRLHWLFPTALGNLPASFWRVLFLAALVPAGLEWFQRLPASAYFVAVALMLAGSLALLVARYIRQPDQRRDVRLLFAVAGIALVPAVAVGVVDRFHPISHASGGSLLAVPLIPGAYLYAAYRRQLGALEFRASRLISLGLFLILLTTVLAALVFLADTWGGLDSMHVLFTLAAVALAVVLAVVGFDRFQELVNRHLLGLPPAPTHLLQDYASRITTSLDVAGLVRVLNDEILARLLIRQSALLSLDAAGRPRLLAAAGLDAPQVPDARDLPALFARAGRYLPAFAADALPPSCSWVRLALPLALGGQPVGLWLLGRRDPDDLYSQAEIATLQALASQTAVALTNIVQTGRLHALHRANIDRHESDRAALARELHDEVLGEVALLSMDLADAPPQFHQALQSLADRLRRTISDLRPPMLNFGLRAALESLADNLAERSENRMAVVLDVPDGPAAYPAHTEQHIFRLLQQAGLNALQHAHAQTIRIHGALEPDKIDLTLEDDGVGFALPQRFDLAALLDGRHYGLVGMFERAAIIGADLRLDTAPGRGTRVRVVWRPPAGAAVGQVGNLPY